MPERSAITSLRFKPLYHSGSLVAGSAKTVRQVTAFFRFAIPAFCKAYAPFTVQLMVQPCMLPMCQQFKVLRSIIKRVAIYMMDVFVGFQWPTQFLTHQKTMLKIPIPSVNFDIPIVAAIRRIVYSTASYRQKILFGKRSFNFINSSNIIAGLSEAFRALPWIPKGLSSFPSNPKNLCLTNAT